MGPGEALDRLVAHISGLAPVCVAFSGGVDSSVVALAAYRAAPKDSVALTVSSELCPDAEVFAAERVAAAIGIRHRIITVDLLDIEGIAGNHPDRCYRCKIEVMNNIRRAAGEHLCSNIIEGSNSDDSGMHRPGLKALRELGIRSPLMELGIGKTLVREIARENGLPNHDRPSSPCLATRFPYGSRLTKSKLRRVGMAEDYLRSLGFREFRVRDHGEVARIELPRPDMARLVTSGLDKKVVAKLTALGYNYVSLDLAGFRTGSMDEGRGGGTF